MSGREVVARVVVTADDLGLHPALNAGILRAHDEGVVTSVSIVSNGSAFAEAAAQCRARPGLGCGVHLTLTGCVPACAPERVASLLGAPGRLRRSWPSLLRALAAGRVRLAEAESEWRAQILRVLDAGLRPSHLNGHQHVHLFPPLFAIARKLAAEFGIGRLRLPASSASWSGGPGATLRDLSVSAAGWLCRRRSPPDSVLCFGIPHSGRLDPVSLAAALRAVARRGAGELVCHPGSCDEALARDLGWGYRWEAELSLLTGPGTQEALRAAGIRRCRFDEL
ncbi:MAG: ChbG/HpnK family deacetylase [Elusimicrobia bacterium]|nr:ChbG/HpnK family deacetylase [Elusimicrobiota bacterium]